MNFYNFQEKSILTFPLASLNKTNIDYQNRETSRFKTRQSGSLHDLLSRSYISLNYRQCFTVIGYSYVSYSQRFPLVLLIPIRYSFCSSKPELLSNGTIYFPSLKTPGYRCRRCYYFFAKYWAARSTLFSFWRYQRGMRAKKYLSDRRGPSKAFRALSRRFSVVRENFVSHWKHWTDRKLQLNSTRYPELWFPWPSASWQPHLPRRFQPPPALPSSLCHPVSVARCLSSATCSHERTTPAAWTRKSSVIDSPGRHYGWRELKLHAWHWNNELDVNRWTRWARIYIHISSSTRWLRFNQV